MAWAAARGKDGLAAHLQSMDIVQLGPLVEYALIQPSLRDYLPATKTALQSAPSRSLDSLVAGAASASTTSLTPEDFEFARVPADLSSPLWVAFTKRLENAATAAGFQNRAAKGFAGAFGELADNVVLHSDHANTGLAAYRHAGNEFEFVVADAGDGVLSTLRTNPVYQHLSDAGEALRLALTDGVSRFPSGERRGYGFRPLFVELTSFWGHLRFRTGDAALTIEGTDPSLPTAKIVQRPPFKGFAISATIRPKKP